ncbi:PREDICTED: vacuolar [Prunus dulcis]|uniref:PREDICTED: vacuolar n=1 Tax=Prunus dulcis TaxID=3755 RepID=A0A5E4EPD9_PRUDU|nr:armadillo repeat-containing protein 3 [Prunus dulcis]VVA17534.1 PREDICTED: vacuolar [Prunus dulcis]
MHRATAAPNPLQTLLDLINSTISLLLRSSLTVRSFVGRWTALHTKLTSLHSSIADISDSPHWAQNPLLHTLLPNLLSTLQRLTALADQCTDAGFTGGKLHMQSDLDMASSSLSNQLRDLDLLLRSGVLHQSNAIVLSLPGPGSDKEDLGFFVRDLFTRLQIGGVEFKKKALESLLQLLNDDGKSSGVVAKEGNVAYLIHLLDFHNQPFVREQAVFAVCLLASANDESSRKAVFEEGGLGPLLRILESGSTHLKEKAAMAVEALTADPENAWALSAYGGVSVLIEACRSGTPATQTHAAGAIINVANVEEIKTALGEEGAVPVLVQLLLSGSITAQEKSANCLAILASSDEYFRALIIQERGLQRLMHLIQDLPSSDTLEHVLRAITSLSASDSCFKVLSSSTFFLIQLGEFIKHGNTTLQQISASLLAHLSINVSDGNKRALGSCMGSLVKLMESPKPVGLQESAAQVLVSLLTVRSNRKELVRDEKSVMRLVQMLDPKNHEMVCSKFPVAVVAAILSGGSGGCRKRLVAAGAYQHLQRLAEMDVVGAKKALQRLAGNRLKTIFSRTWRE